MARGGGDGGGAGGGGGGGGGGEGEEEGAGEEGVDVGEGGEDEEELVLEGCEGRSGLRAAGERRGCERRAPGEDGRGGEDDVDG